MLHMMWLDGDLLLGVLVKPLTSVCFGVGDCSVKNVMYYKPFWRVTPPLRA